VLKAGAAIQVTSLYFGSGPGCRSTADVGGIGYEPGTYDVYETTAVPATDFPAVVYKVE
jgi:hypothetical protein